MSKSQRSETPRQGSVLDIRNLSVEYRGPGGTVPTVDAFTFSAKQGVIYGIVGESGSGKSTVALAALGWTSAAMRRVSGESHLLGQDILALPPKALRRIWGRHIGYVPQEVGGALHPSFRIRRQFRETLRINQDMGRSDSDNRALELLDAAGIPNPEGALRRYPHEFSGGQLQRIAICLALAPRPQLLILDEPTTGLDVTTQRTVVEVVRKLATEEGVGVLFISHDISLLAEYADELVVMYAGEVVEAGPVDLVLGRPRHPYTRALVDAVPSPKTPALPAKIAGLPPGRVVEGACAFATRCAHERPPCAERKPPLVPITSGHLVRCARVSELTLTAATNARPQLTRTTGDVVLEASGITVRYQGVLAVDDVSLSLRTGSVTALVGESGSGKSSLGHVIAGLRSPTGGTLRFGGQSLAGGSRRRTKQQRREIQLIFQSTSGSLNPRRLVGDHLSHVASCFVEANRREAAVAEILDAVQLSSQLLDRYPSELSGGQKQRVAIAGAFLADPAVVVCDEITSGQDVSVQAAILEGLAAMQNTHRTAVLFISHDLGVVRAVADEVHVMQAGRVVEHAATEDLYCRPEHSYTRDLLAAVPGSSITTEGRR